LAFWHKKGSWTHRLWVGLAVLGGVSGIVAVPMALAPWSSIWREKASTPVTVPGPDGLTAMFPGTDQASTSNSAPTQTEAGR